LAKLVSLYAIKSDSKLTLTLMRSFIAQLWLDCRKAE